MWDTIVSIFYWGFIIFCIFVVWTVGLIIYEWFSDTFGQVSAPTQSDKTIYNGWYDYVVNKYSDLDDLPEYVYKIKTVADYNHSSSGWCIEIYEDEESYEVTYEVTSVLFKSHKLYNEYIHRHGVS
jgi:hypothetical protein